MTKADVIDAAFKAWGRGFYLNTSLSYVARELQVCKPALYRHFRNKQALLNAMIVYFFVRFFTGHTISGWASIACSLWGIGGLILFSIGIVGEYIGKIYLETKHRPRYHIERRLFGKEKTDNE